MQTRMLVLLSVCALVARPSEGAWFGTVWGGVKKLAAKAVAVIVNNCSVGIPRGISCSGRRRDVRNADFMLSEKKLCDEVMHERILAELGMTFDLVKDVFEAVDNNSNITGDGNDILDEVEFAAFQESLDLLRHCFS
ncbi:uncharacterized protein [Littorina saxatilis]|uniref:Uncharacterized protein n=1 Tax=Littorina saxatilis TaxID=31220 RepID=A0AAN9FYA2_9CAEN